MKTSNDSTPSDALAAAEKWFEAKCAAIGSNYMLNIGPDLLGRIPVEGVRILDGLAQAV